MSAKTACNTERLSIERMAARGFVIAGGIFWIVAAFAGPFFYDNSSMGSALSTALYPLAATAATLLIGWTYERLAAVLLFAGAAGVIVWGVLFGWEVGVWLLMTVVLLAPITIAGVLFMLAGRMEDICALEARVAEQAAAEKTAGVPSRTTL